MEKSIRRFNGNHWFHIGEYYISRRQLLMNILDDAIDINNLLQKDITINLVFQSKQTFRFISKFTFFLIILSLGYRPEVKEVNIFQVQEEHLNNIRYIKDSLSNKKYITVKVTNNKPSFTYRRDESILNRFTKVILPSNYFFNIIETHNLCGQYIGSIGY